MDKALYSAITNSNDFRPGDMEHFFERFQTKTNQSSYQMLIENEKIRAGMDVLELPSGSGAIAKILVDLVGEEGQVIAVDFNQDELDLIRDQRVIKKREAAQYLSLEENSIDYVFCHLGLMLFNPLEPALKEVFRVLRDGGVLVANLIEPNTNKAFQIFSKTSLEYQQHIQRFPGWGDPRVNEKENLEQVFHNIGFSVPLEYSKYVVSLKGSSKEIIESAKVFFQIHYMLDDSKRKEYRALLMQQLQQLEDPEKKIKLEISCKKIRARKIY
ncbi:MAG: methyltransferase domain-containing protein [Bdellovibrionales bacterium]|nr:methyltransferase domain-containing protein [Bdellovibrionales bacterium]